MRIFSSSSKCSTLPQVTSRSIKFVHAVSKILRVLQGPVAIVVEITTDEQFAQLGMLSATNVVLKATTRRFAVPKVRPSEVLEKVPGVIQKNSHLHVARSEFTSWPNARIAKQATNPTFST